ncbi:MAG: hypothetical protein WAN23_03960, partial [Candidatus Acidiferrales bacterium]
SRSGRNAPQWVVFFAFASGDRERKRIFRRSAGIFLIFETFPLTRNGRSLESGNKWQEVVGSGRQISGFSKG